MFAATPMPLAPVQSPALTPPAIPQPISQAMRDILKTKLLWQLAQLANPLCPTALHPSDPLYPNPLPPASSPSPSPAAPPPQPTRSNKHSPAVYGVDLHTTLPPPPIPPPQRPPHPPKPAPSSPSPLQPLAGPGPSPVRPLALPPHHISEPNHPPRQRSPHGPLFPEPIVVQTAPPPSEDPHPHTDTTDAPPQSGAYERNDEPEEVLLQRKLKRAQEGDIHLQDGCEEFWVSDPLGEFSRDPNIERDFARMGLPTWLVTNLHSRGLQMANEAQGHIIHMAQSRDIMVVVQTGMGKTACFLTVMLKLTFPVLKQQWVRRKSEIPSQAVHAQPHGIIISPTRELAMQTYEELRLLVKGSMPCTLKPSLITGGVDEEKEQRQVRGAHYIVATPGRFDVFVRRRVIGLEQCRSLVLDECDKLLEGSMSKQLDPSISTLREKGADVLIGLYTATRPMELEELAQNWLQRTFLLIQLGKQLSTGPNINEQYAPVLAARPSDPPALSDYLAVLLRFLRPGERCVVFCSQRASADWLYEQLEAAGYPCWRHHSGLEQAEREAVIRAFEEGEERTLVACGALSRGMDLGCTVYCFENAASISDHIHRVGRTGRAGAPGRTLTFVWPGEKVFCNLLVHHMKSSRKEFPPWLADGSRLDALAAEAYLTERAAAWIGEG